MTRASSIAPFAALALAACAAGPDYRRPAAPTPDAAAAAFSSAADAQATTQAPSTVWWEAFQDPSLNALVADALNRNRDIAVARANLRAARAALGEARSQFLPQGQVQASNITTRPSAAAEGLPVDTPLDEVDLYDAGIDASWEIDLFGRVRRGSEAARAGAQQQRALLQGVRVSVISETALAYFDLRGAQARLQVARANAENQAQSFELTQALFRAGRVSGLDAARAEGQLAATRATIPPLEAAEAAAAFRLAVLTGRGPAELRESLLADQPLPATPTALAAGDPQSLIAARPDVVAAERALAAATARIGIAQADLFPTIAFTGSFGAAALSTDDLGEDGATRFSFGPLLSWNWNIFQTRARIVQADARAEAALAQYEQAVLTALEDVEGALVRLAQERRRNAELDVSARANSEAARLSRLRYRYGAEDFLSVLDAERAQLQSEDQLAASNIQVAREYIAVHRALGAGPPTPR